MSRDAIASKNVLIEWSLCKGTQPNIESWPGEADFQFEVEEKGNSKKRGYTYSKFLNKLYIEMDKLVAFKFFMRQDYIEHDLVIRALPVFIDVSERAQPVVRHVF